MNGNPLKLLIRADAGPGIGTGHVTRTIALGQAWKKLQGDVTFVAGNLPRGLIRQIQNEGFRFIQLNDPKCDAGDARDTLEIASFIEPDWLVLAGNRFTESYHRKLARQSTRFLVVGDQPSYQHADLVLDSFATSNTAAGSARHESSARMGASDAAESNLIQISGHSERISGIQYALLRNEFNTVNDDESNKRTFSVARRLLVNFPGEDIDNWGLKTLKQLSNLNQHRLIVDCIVAPEYRHLESLHRFKRKAHLHLRLHRNVDRMSALMQRIDMAILAGGTTCYELARCGVPMIIVPMTPSQTAIAQSLEDSDAAMIFRTELTGDHSSSKEEDRLKECLQQLINDRERRQSMSAAGMDLIDGEGSNRIARRMLGRCYYLREAKNDDAKQSWIWTNNPEVRSVSFDEKKTSFSDHQSWLRKKLASDQSKCWIAENKSGQPLGQLVVDWDQSGIGYLSVIVDQARRGRGLGTVLIESGVRAAFEELPVTEIVVQINPVNVASERVFRRAGFRPKPPTTINGKVANQFVLERSWLDAPVAAPARRKKSA